MESPTNLDKEKERLNAEILKNGHAFTKCYPAFVNHESNYDDRAPIYDERSESPEIEKRQNDMDVFYHKVLQDILAGKKIKYLDFGCATAKHTIKFLEGLREYASVEAGYAVDISPKMVEIAKDKLPEFQVSEGGVEKLSFNNELDLVTAFFHVPAHLDEVGLETFFKNVSASLKPGGVLCFDVLKRTKEHEEKGNKFTLYHSFKFDGTKVLGSDGKPIIGVIRMFTKEEIIDFAQKNGFEVVKIEEILVEKREGNDGDLAVVLRKKYKN